MNDKHKIKAGIQELLDNTKVSQNQLAKQMGVSPAIISQILNEEWNFIADKMWNKIASYLKLDKWKIVRTKQFNIMQELCRDAQENSRFIGINGFTGCGKTTALKFYQKQNPGVFYVLCNFMMTRRDFLDAIQKALGIEEGERTYDKLYAITGKLNQYQKPLLILDDAGKLNDPCYRILQLLYDELEHSCGIVVAGVEYLQWYIDKMSYKNKMGFRELKRRVEYWQFMPAISKQAVKDICLQQGIDDEHAVNYIHRVCKDYGTMRAMLTNAKRVSEKSGEPVTVELLSGLGFVNEETN